MMDEIGEGLNSLESKGKFGIDGPEQSNRYVYEEGYNSMISEMCSGADCLDSNINMKNTILSYIQDEEGQ